MQFQFKVHETQYICFFFYITTKVYKFSVQNQPWISIDMNLP